MKVTTSIRRVRTLLKGIREGSLDPTPDFQRRLVWTNADKLKFLDTTLKGLPFPEIYVAAGGVDTVTGEGKEVLVDGQQRIMTLYQYFTGSEAIRLGTSLVAYSGLLEQQKLDFLEYEVVVRDLGALPQEEIIDIFSRINATQYSLNAMEIDHARFQGTFKQLGVEIANHPLFEDKRVFSANEIRRMSDVSFALSLAVTVMSTYFNRDSEITPFLEQYNDEFEGKDDVERELNIVFSFVSSLNLPRNSRAWKKSDLFTLLVEIHRLLIRENLELDPARVSQNLSQFYLEVTQQDDIDFDKFQFDPKELHSYFQSSVQATNDRFSRIRRGAILRRVILRSTNAQGAA